MDSSLHHYVKIKVVVLSGAKFKKPLSHGDELLDFAPLNTTRETLMNPALNHPSTLPGGRGY